MYIEINHFGIHLALALFLSISLSLTGRPICHRHWDLFVVSLSLIYSVLLSHIYRDAYVSLTQFVVVVVERRGSFLCEERKYLCRHS